MAKETGLGLATVHVTIKGADGLEKRGIVKPIEERNWGPSKVGRKMKKYILTFRGLIKFIGTTTLPDSTIDEILRIHASLHDYAMFSEWENLKKEWFGDSIYMILHNAALSTMQHPYSPIVSRSQESMKRPIDPREYDEIAWRNNFTWFFLKEIAIHDEKPMAMASVPERFFEPLFIIEKKPGHPPRLHVMPLAHKPIRNAVISKLVKQLLEERRFQCYFHLAEIKKLKELFTPA